MRSKVPAAVRTMVTAVSLLCLTLPASGQPTADQVLSSAGFSEEDKQRVLNGEFVTASAKPVSDRDLAVSMAFLVKTSPEALSRLVVTGSLITADAQVQAYSVFKNPGSLADLAGLRITLAEVKALAGARAGSSLNLSAAEIAAFHAVPAGDQQTVLPQLQKMLLVRYQAYRASGLAGIKPYARGGGVDRDLASDLRKATEAAQNLAQFLPRFHALLLSYPKGMDADIQENFFWMRSVIQGKPTYVLQQTLVVADGNARAVAQRQFYASTGYNGEQAIAGFLPVSGGTIVVYSSHAFTDQVTGFGGFAKRGIGSRLMADTLTKQFEASRTRAVQ
jgi:hypothetical protein